MARKIADIQQQIIDALKPGENNLSTSKYAEWRLLTHVVAAAIYTFEIILDLFRAEVEKKAFSNTAGTADWYAEMCRRFQYGHQLVYDKDTAFYSYAKNYLNARIVKAVAIVENDRHLFIKVAKQDENGSLVPLTDKERLALVDYWRTMRIGGTQITIISTTADLIRYNLEVYYDPATSQDIIKADVLKALEEFKTSLSFNAMFYGQRLIDAVMAVNGVMTVNPVALEHKKSDDVGFSDAGVMVELGSGYFNYADENTLTLISVR